MEEIVRTWSLFGALVVALAVGAASALAGVSFFGLLVRILIGTSAFLMVSGMISGFIARSLLRRIARGAGPETEADR